MEPQELSLYESIHFTLHKEQECREKQKTSNTIFEKKHTEKRGQKNQKRERIRLFSRDKRFYRKFPTPAPVRDSVSSVHRIGFDKIMEKFIEFVGSWPSIWLRANENQTGLELIKIKITSRKELFREKSMMKNLKDEDSFLNWKENPTQSKS